MISWFKRNIGEEYVSEEDAAKAVYNSDASQIEGKTVLVVRPGNAKEVHQIILFVKRNHANIVIRGGGTGLVGGAVPENSVVMDLSRMNKILSQGIDFVVVEPGIILEDLNNQLEDKHFPVIPASYKSCTIGGMIATNAVGMRAVKYGKTGNWVREVEIIDGDGRIRRADLNNVIGKEGITGIIISAKLRIINKPKKRKVEMFEFDYLQEVMFKLKEFEDVSAVEFINKEAAVLAGLEEDKYYLIVEKEDEEEGGEEYWKIREDLYPKLASKGYSIIEDPKISLANMEKFLKWLDENKIPAFGHINVGIIHPCFENEDKLEEMYDLVSDLGGEVSGEHGIGIKKKRFVSKEFKEKIKNLKIKYDVNNVLNRGKLI